MPNENSTSSPGGAGLSAYEHVVVVGAHAVDQNDHVNNVEYVQWMQDAATAHSDAVGCTFATIAAGATWMVRTHHVEYLRPCFKNESITIRTWISNAHRVRSRRSYEFLGEDGIVRARAWTDWVFVDVSTGRPRAIPDDIIDLFGIVPGGSAEVRGS